MEYLQRHVKLLVNSCGEYLLMVRFLGLLFDRLLSGANLCEAAKTG